MSGTNQIQLRQAFKAVKSAYLNAGGREPIVTPSDLRLEVLVSQNKNAYQFKILSNETNPDFAAGFSNTEIRLNINDSFWAVLAGLYIALPASATDAEYKLYSYPNPTKFTAAIADALNMFFNNCTLDIDVNNVKYIQNFSTMRFRNSGVSQEGLGATSSTAAPAAIPSTLLDQFSGNDSGLSALGTLIEMPGQKKTLITLNAPTGLSVAPGATTRLIFVLRGFLALNASQR
jgi:hypothetical protein